MSTNAKLERRQVLTPADQWQSKPRWQSFASSMVFHVTLLLLLAWLWQPSGNGTGAERDRPVGIAVIHQTAGSNEYFLEPGGQGDSASNESTSASESASSSDALAKAVEAFASQSTSTNTVDSLLGDFATLDAATVQTSVQSGAADSGMNSVGKSGQGSTGTGGAGVGNGRGAKGTTKTQVFGIEGTGNSFAYVFDRSDSMNGFEGAPFRAAKRELLKSLETLKSVNQFQIIFYNETPNAYQGSLSGTRQLIYATDNERQAAIEYVRSMNAIGGTEHVPALRTGAALSPDVLFFLTDAADPNLSDGQLNDIVDRCTARGTTIHSIEFGSGSSPGSGRWIEQLAIRTGGKYRYVDIVQIDR
jgi:K+-transporting ATPase c subunit